ncbi:MAG: UDP-glucose 4-epimerase GalE [Candidatus Shapirobacteria bacterium]|nr:UDP-glucose 4-epimerase GalE [Candidatus Shapirobacteria bacterium]MDD5481870.1 UDP-glucose 4-epimerase GalE [Candidatus Shapirobacteria bacterium]
MNKKKVLVTGGAGYIGSHAVKALLEAGRPVLVFDNLCRGYREVIEVLRKKYPRLELVVGDLKNRADIEAVFTQNDIDGVLHFAALCLVNESMEEPAKYFENNVLGTLNLLRAMKNHEVGKLVFSSTCAVYGEAKYLPIDEKHPTVPVNPYGESKLMAEREIFWFSRLFSLKAVAFRYFNVAGASSDGLIGDSKKPSQLLVQNAVRGALGIEPFKLTCPKVDTPDGTPIRDYVNVEDLARAHVLALDYLGKKESRSHQVFNLGTGQGNSVLEIINRVWEITGAKFPLGKGPARKGEYAKVYANINKVKKELGWRPEKSLPETVCSLVAWYNKHPHGWSF